MYRSNASRGLVLVLALAVYSPLEAAEGLRPILIQQSEVIAKRLGELKSTTVYVKDPEAPRAGKAAESSPLPNAQPQEARRILIEVLKQHGIKEDSEARYHLEFDYQQAVFNPTGGELQSLVLALKLVDSVSRTSVHRDEKVIRDSETLRRLQGLLASPLELKLRELAARIARELETRPDNKIALGSFHGVDQQGTGIKKLFSDELARQKNSKGPVSVELGAATQLRGEYELVEDGPGRLGVVLRVQVVDRLGKRIGEEMMEKISLSGTGVEKSQDVDGLYTLLQFAPTTCDYPLDKSQPQRILLYQEALKTPSAFIEESRWVKKDGKSPFALAIKVNGEFRAPKIMNGQAFVELKKGETYEIVVKSGLPNPLDAAVKVSIDGLSVFTYSDIKHYTHFIVPSGKEAIIPGWHRTNEKVDAFKVDSYADGPIKPAAGTGTVLVTFAAAWPKGANPPEDEKLYAQRCSTDEKLRTTRGPEKKVDLKEVERVIGGVRASITIRYSR